MAEIASLFSCERPLTEIRIWIYTELQTQFLINTRREYENKTLGLKKCSMINMTSATEIFKKFSTQFEGYFVLPKQITGKTGK